jgi:hypothetical protein
MEDNKKYQGNHQELLCKTLFNQVGKSTKNGQMCVYI